MIPFLVRVTHPDRTNATESMEIPMTHVSVVYQETREGKEALKMAASVATQLGLNPLTVLVARNPHAAAALQPILNADELLVKNMSASVQNLTGSSEFVVELFDEGTAPQVGAEDVLVGPAPTESVPYHVLNPGTENSVTGRRHGPVLVPFGSGESALVAATAAFALVQNCDAFPKDQPQVIFYHTTWQDPISHSREPIDQMCEAAERIMLALQQAADKQGINYHTVIETHDDIVQGIIEMAFKTDCVLIAMARGKQITQGSNVDRACAQSPIPVLVTASGTPKVSEPADSTALAAHLKSRLRERADCPAVKTESWTSGLREIFHNPMFVMAVSATMYVLKVVSKCLAGRWLMLTTMLADGVHNIGDLLQSFIVMIVIKVSHRPENERYPVGRANLEWVASALIGALLYFAAAFFMVQCLLGLLAAWWPADDAAVRAFMWLPSVEIAVLTRATFPWVVAIMTTSIVLSLVVSRYQIAVGRSSGHESMVADGSETRGDALIELVVLIGIVADYMTGWLSIQYLCGIFVAVKICGTAKELVQGGYRVLNQHSIEPEYVQALHEAAMSVSGVINVEELTAIQIGHKVLVWATIETMARSAAMDYVRRAVEAKLDAYLLDPARPFHAAKLRITTKRSDPKRKRIAYALCSDGKTTYVAPTMAQATHIAFCDVEYGQVVRTEKDEIIEDWIGLLLRKRAQKLYVLQPEVSVNDALSAEATMRIAKAHRADVVPVPVLAEARSYTLSPVAVVA